MLLLAELRLQRVHALLKGFLVFLLLLFADRPAATPPPGPPTAPTARRKAISTPPATTGSRSSARSPRTRPSAPRTSCRSGRCPASWPGSAPPRRSPSSRRTCATTATTRPAPTAPLAAWPKPTGSWPGGAGHHGRADLPGRRTDRDHLRRGQRRGRLLRRDLRARPLPPQCAPAREDRPRRAAAPARSCCPRSSGPAPSAPFRTTTTRCCAPSRKSSACRTWATRPCRRSGPSARTYSARSRCAPP